MKLIALLGQNRVPKEEKKKKNQNGECNAGLLRESKPGDAR